MMIDEFIKNAVDPNAWLRKAKSFRDSADTVWERFVKELVDSVDKKTRDLDKDKFESANNILRNCQFLYSLCAECALKGLIIKNEPESTAIETVIDGNGHFVSAQFKRIGTTKIGTHNLVTLAELAGVLNKNGDPELRELLLFSTHCIQWLGRYPVPLDSESCFIPIGKIHPAAFDHYFRDFMDPFLNNVFGRLKY